MKRSPPLFHMPAIPSCLPICRHPPRPASGLLPRTTPGGGSACDNYGKPGPSTSSNSGPWEYHLWGRGWRGGSGAPIPDLAAGDFSLPPRAPHIKRYKGLSKITLRLIEDRMQVIPWAGIKYPSSTEKPANTWTYTDRQQYR
jgi:hypothetical protein